MNHNKRALMTFVERLEQYIAPANVINPWRDYVEGYDIGPVAVEIRRDNLRRYLSPRISVAQFILIAEAVGYQGARFSGVPLTSERMVTGNHSFVDYQMIFSGKPSMRTSLPNIPKLNQMQEKYGFAEPTASIIWEAALSCRRWKPTDFIFWNMYPFHPFKSSQEMMTNRTPTPTELREGMKFADHLFRLNPNAHIIAIGRKAANTLTAYNVSHFSVPHPANGRAHLFRGAIKAILDPTH